MIDLNSTTQAGDRVNWCIDQALEAQRAAEPDRQYLGCSYLGADCERAVQLAYLPTAPSRPITAQLLRRFQRGDLIEDRAAEWLRMAGFDLRTSDPSTGRQFEVSFLDGRVRGHADGILTGFYSPYASEPPVALPALWECKCLSHKFFMQVKKDGLAKAAPKYAGQVQLYIAGLGLPRCLLTVANADTMELMHLAIPFDEAAFGKLIARAQRILQACELGEIVPRGFDKPTHYKCKMCEYVEPCWRDR